MRWRVLLLGIPIFVVTIIVRSNSLLVELDRSLAVRRLLLDGSLSEWDTRAMFEMSGVSCRTLEASTCDHDRDTRFLRIKCEMGYSESPRGQT